MSVSSGAESHLSSSPPKTEGAEAYPDESATYPLAPSPRLSRRTQKEVVAENDTTSSQDPDNYPLHSPWSFWFDRWAGTISDIIICELLFPQVSPGCKCW